MTATERLHARLTSRLLDAYRDATNESLGVDFRKRRLADARGIETALTELHLKRCLRCGWGKPRRRRAPGRTR